MIIVFLPYIFGSGQLTTCPVGGKPARGVPNTGDIIKKEVVDDWREMNLYFSAIGFINDVKTGPFWEHSPILYDVTGVQGGWPKINQGMIKMYHAEVLGKFPVVQHFLFGSIFPWPNVFEGPPHAKSATPISSTPAAPLSQPPTRAPWAKPGSLPPASTILPGTPRQPFATGGATAVPRSGGVVMPPPGPGGTSAPRAVTGGGSGNILPPPVSEGTRAPWASGGDDGTGKMLPPSGSGGTRAPWAR